MLIEGTIENVQRTLGSATDKISKTLPVWFFTEEETFRGKRTQNGYIFETMSPLGHVLGEIIAKNGDMVFSINFSAHFTKEVETFLQMEIAYNLAHLFDGNPA